MNWIGCVNTTVVNVGISHSGHVVYHWLFRKLSSSSVNDAVCHGIRTRNR